MKNTRENPVNRGQEKQELKPAGKQSQRNLQNALTPGTELSRKDISPSSFGKSVPTTTPVLNTKPGNHGLRGLFEGQLKDIYWAEQQLTKTIPHMIEKATSVKLMDALKDHLSKTEMQVSRCENVFQTLNLNPATTRNVAIEGLIREANGLIDSTVAGSVRDAGIICAAQKLDHYKIATYGTLSAIANTLGEPDAARLLNETVKEEREADKELTQVAELSIYPETGIR